METHTSLIKAEIRSLFDTAIGISIKDTAKAIELTEKALFKSQRIKEKNEIHADGLNLVSMLHRKNREIGTAKNMADRALKLSEEIKYEKGVYDAKYNIAKALLNQHKLSEAIPHLLDASVGYKKMNELLPHGKALCLIGNIYEEFQDFKNALNTYQYALEVSQQTQNQTLEFYCYLYLANLFLQLEKSVKAVTYIGKCIELNKALENDEDLAKVYFVNGKIQLKSRKYEAATESFLKASELFFDKNDFVSGVEAQEKLASTYLAQDKTDQAIETLNSVIQKSEKFQLNSVLFNTHYMLYQIYKETNVTKALEELERYVELKGEHDKKFINSVVNSYSVLSRIEDSEKEAEKEQELASIIEKKNSEMDSFFYRVSHDLKGPIASLLGLSDLAKRDVSDTKALHYLKMYENQIKRLNMIVMELINITELNYREIKRTDINFYEIIDNCITAYTYLPNFDSIVFKIEVQSNLTFSSEWYIVNTILQNLIENSIKYLDKNKEESTVHITVYGTKTDIHIEVKDNGQGIDKEHQGKIFDMFYRANNSAQGTGLGLFILKRAVERLHGEIKLESTPGIGTTFNISLPKNI
ncbi:hypothetical protein GCM10011506_10380 [Marivirga lumbricoides]|uniref:histidine kinase n=1 Tax=Marivirga lumbricoides TaxID=1046115 RepID=A0ABQ1LMM6_9BACT|nr:hypothetical protein GCM10011506_10380 [Marivirga lumbricoides]